jgi:hypothetical protein
LLPHAERRLQQPVPKSCPLHLKPSSSLA